MNVYDFDGTIYDGDSSIDFYLFEVKRHPAILRCLPGFLMSSIRYKMKKLNKTELKESFFSFLKMIPDVPTEVDLFWNMHYSKIREWYKNKRKEDDLIISASPVFLLQEACNRLKIDRLIASDVDEKTGHFRKANCHGEKKVEYFLEQYGKESLDEFYSDSYSDEPMAKIARKAFLIKHGQIHEWKTGDCEETNTKI